VSNTPWWMRYLPLLLFELYLTGSVAVFAFGPLQWTVDNSGTVLSYVLLGQLLILAGYRLGLAFPARGYRAGRFIDLPWKAAILITLVLLPPTWSTRNFAEISLLEALANPALPFHAKFLAELDYQWLSILRTLLAPILALLVPLGLVYWQRIRMPWRVLWLLAVSGRIAVAILTGRAFGIFDVALVVPWMLVLHLRQTGSDRRQAWRACVATATVFVVCASAWAYFSHSRRSRAALAGPEYTDALTGWSERLYGVELPESAERDLYYLSRYLSLGYYGLSGCLDLPFEWTGGIGHSLFLTRYAGLLSPRLDWVRASTYPARLETATGYSSVAAWHTAYAWLASDLTFPGALVFVACAAAVLGLAWCDSLVGANPFAVGFVSQAILFFYYLPANNVRMANPEAAFSLYGLFGLWLWTRHLAAAQPGSSAVSDGARENAAAASSDSGSSTPGSLRSSSDGKEPRLP